MNPLTDKDIFPNPENNARNFQIVCHVCNISQMAAMVLGFVFWGTDHESKVGLRNHQKKILSQSVLKLIILIFLATLI